MQNQLFLSFIIWWGVKFRSSGKMRTDERNIPTDPQRYSWFLLKTPTDFQPEVEKMKVHCTWHGLILNNIRYRFKSQTFLLLLKDLMNNSCGLFPTEGRRSDDSPTVCCLTKHQKAADPPPTPRPLTLPPPPLSSLFSDNILDLGEVAVGTYSCRSDDWYCSAPWTFSSCYVITWLNTSLYWLSLDLLP